MEECIICFEETDQFIFFDCSHKVCNTCYPKLKRCPLCRENKIIINVPIIQTNNPYFLCIFLWCCLIVLICILILLANI